MSPLQDPAAHLLVTGASGCVGGAVCLAARARGWRVTGLVREGSEVAWLTEAGYDRNSVRSVWTKRNPKGIAEFVPAGVESRITGAQLFGARK